MIKYNNGEVNLPSWLNGPNEKDVNISSIWNKMKFVYARRLLNLANSDNKTISLRAVEHLARIKNLEKWQYSLLANTCDAVTAVNLARTEGVNMLLFIRPPSKFMDHDHHMLVNELRDYLSKLDSQSDHSCLKKFISQAFVEVYDLDV